MHYLIKNSQIVFKNAKEQLYGNGSRVDKAVYILLYGRCKMKLNNNVIGHIMGIGYIFNEHVLFPRNRKETVRM